MGQKTHPIGFRLGTTVPWQARWFASGGKAYSALAIEDQKIRKMISTRYEDSGGISKTEIERGPQELVISIHTARPGIVIGRGGTRVDELRSDLEKLTGKRARLNIQEIRQPELDAYLVARNVAEQLERRVAFRRAMRQSITRTMQAGAQGIKIVCGGRLGGAEIARTEKAMDGRVPLHTLRANVDFAIAEAATTFGRIGVKAWIYTGDLSTGAAIVGTAMRQADAPAEDSRPGRRARRTTRPSGPRPGGGRGRGGGGDQPTAEGAVKAPASAAPEAGAVETKIIDTPPETAPEAAAKPAPKTAVRKRTPKPKAAPEETPGEEKE
ncbi:MAG: 30S ribosomal protein S3 [Chloroflexi bacterium]|nr:30S ribosomal protein S3 [Chloroflexota bacterium]